MPLSQFDSAKLEPHALGKQGFQQITAKGPLQDVDPTDYTPPFVIHVTIIQNPENDHNPINAKRASGYTTMDAAGIWEATIDAPAGVFDLNRPARGIGVAVFGRTQGYTSEVLTWCDHLAKLDGTVS
jgi:hypothetical protein